MSWFLLFVFIFIIAFYIYQIVKNIKKQGIFSKSRLYSNLEPRTPIVYTDLQTPSFPIYSEIESRVSRPTTRRIPNIPRTISEDYSNLATVQSSDDYVNAPERFSAPAEDIYANPRGELPTEDIYANPRGESPVEVVYETFR